METRYKIDPPIYSPELDITYEELLVTRYINNDNTALQLVTNNPTETLTLTTNIVQLQPDAAVINIHSQAVKTLVRHCPFIMKVPVSHVTSGYNRYPIHYIMLDELTPIEPKDMDS